MISYNRYVFLRLVTVCIFFLLTFSSLCGCDSRNYLVFEDIESFGRGSLPWATNTQIVIVDNAENLPEAIKWVSSEAKEAILKINYSEYFTVIAFRGAGHYARRIKIQKIWQDEGRIFVQAFFDDYPPQAGRVPEDWVTSPYDVVKVNKERLIPRGDFNFILFDDSVKIRADVLHTLR